MTSHAPVLAFDLGGTKLAAAMVSGEQVLERRQILTPEDRSPQSIVQTLLKLSENWLEQVTHLAVAATGHVNHGRITAPNQQTLPWTDVDLKTLLEQATGKPSTVLNDADAAAWGEFRFGAGVGSSRMMFVTVSTGVGAGLVLEGRLLEGAELGFTRLEDGTPLEFVASGAALDRYAVKRGWTDTRELLERVFEDQDAQILLERTARLLADKLWDAHQLLCLERVVLGGGLGLAPGFLERVRKYLDGGPEMVLAELGADAGLVGAANWSAARAV